MRAAMAIVFVSIVSGCRDVAGTGFPFGDNCEETSQPENFGCVDIQGVVLDARGRPIEGADVGPAAGINANGLQYRFVFTDSDGRYELRLLKIEAAAPSSFTLQLKGAARNPAGVEIGSQVVDAVVIITPVGNTPEPITVNFTVPTG
jgi:hypothetical protein